MAVMKKKGSKGLPPISTASLPDVIFMILFFFMVSTTMRDQELLVRYKLPEATEVQKLEKKSRSSASSTSDSPRWPCRRSSVLPRVSS